MEYGEAVYQDHRDQLKKRGREQVKERVEKGYQFLAESRPGAAVYCAATVFDRLRLWESFRGENKRLRTGASEFTLAVDKYLEDRGRWMGDRGRALRKVAADRRNADAGQVTWNAIREHYAAEGEVGQLYDTATRQAVGAPATAADLVRIVLEAAEYQAARRGIVEVEKITYTIGEDFEASPLHELWEKRREQDRILTVLVVARDGATGVGKSTLAVQLCKEWDTEWTAERATNQAREYRRLIHSEPSGSVLLADEFATMFDARRALSTENVEASQDWQMIRKLQVSTIGTCPAPGAVDSRFKNLMDIMIVVTRRGEGNVYRIKQDDTTGEPFREKLCSVEWSDLDDDADYQAIEEMKEARLNERLSGDTAADVDAGSRREGRNETIRALVDAGVTHATVADALDLDRSTVTKIVSD
jgi:hypothetical protein